MASVIHLDTHVVLWLYAGRDDLLSSAARGNVERHESIISPIVVLELEYLREIGRVTVASSEVVGDLGARIGLSVSDASFQVVIDAARRLTWTRDPFDRIIAGQSIAESAPLVTRDETIRAHHRGAIW